MHDAIDTKTCGPHTLHWVKPEDCAQISSSTELTTEEQALADSYKATGRRDEFIVGRHLFHAVTGDRAPLLRGSHGQPAWPKSMHGALTHKQGHVMFGYVPKDQNLGFGIDLERTAKMRAEFKSKLCVEQEEQVLAKCDLASIDTLTLIFSFKESIFKCLHPLENVFFYFPDAAVTNIDTSRGTIQAKLLTDVSAATPTGYLIDGHFQFFTHANDRLVLTTATAPVPT